MVSRLGASVRSWAAVRLPRALIAALAVLALGASGLYAVGTATPPVVYTGCLSRFTGFLYNVALGTSPLRPCLPGDTIASWNNTGPAGPPGPPGPVPDPGALSYYFISGNTFTPYGGSIAYFRQSTGCVNQMPRDVSFSAPVHLPQGAIVTAIRLYSTNPDSSTTVGSAYFILNNGKGTFGYTHSATSQASVTGYQQNDSSQTTTTTIQNDSYSYQVDWRTTGTSDSLYLSLCGVRITYHM